ncbi:MAG: GntR family transcriptional regulator [Chloroflexi bacterium]|nr:GntR family transcriptional regulator [Chloroflexota bacterium]
MAVALPTAPRYEQIAQTLRARMLSGELRTGDQLPPERELSQSFLVNRLTLRRASCKSRGCWRAAAARAPLLPSQKLSAR